MSSHRFLLTSGDFQESFSSVLKRTLQLQIACAWATMGKPLDLISQFPIETTSFIGTSFSATSPDALEALSRLGNVYIDERTDRVFHPKLYLFQVREGYVAIIGSPNLTDAAFTRNEEIAMQVELDFAAAQPLLNYFKQLETTMHRLTPQVLERYRQSYRPPSTGMMTRRVEIEGPMVDRRTSPASFAVRGQLLREEWHSYFETLKARSNEEHGRESLFNSSGSYLETLRRLAPILQVPFKGLDREQMRKVIGDELEGYDYGWFGSLRANGQGRHELLENDGLRESFEELLPQVKKARTEERALEVARELFETAVSIRGIKQATPTRFLAIYRPDLFFSVNNPSLQRLSLLFGISDAELKRWEGYAQALQMIWRAKWYHSSRPLNDREGRAWDARVALLDAYAYNADERE